jgi:hypothetical protein
MWWAGQGETAGDRSKRGRANRRELQGMAATSLEDVFIQFMGQSTDNMA